MIVFAPLRQEDIPAVLELEQVCFPEGPWGRLSFEGELNNPATVFLTVRDEDGNLVGYGGVWFMYDEGNITNLAVAPARRRAGLGRRILEELIRLCRREGMESVTLEVRAGNAPAIALYQSAGFQPCGLRKRYYQRKEDAVIMRMPLAEKETEKDADSGD